MDLEKIGNFITQCRKEKQLTQSQLAEKLNISNKTISKWETGNGMPDSSIMIDLCDQLGINVNELLSGEHIPNEEYQGKATENIINITKECENNKKIRKKHIIILTIIIFVALTVISIYENMEINIDYDNRLITCEITDDNITCWFKGLSLVYLGSESVNTDTETLIFISGKMFLQNKIRSHFEAWDSMAQSISGKHIRFTSGTEINIKEDIPDCKEKIKIYYTNISLKKIKKANQKELQEIIQQSHLMAEN